MPRVDALINCVVHDSFRVAQVVGMFDLPTASVQTRRFSAQVPGLDEPWKIGLIVGPSGSGKSTIARHAFGEVHTPDPWPVDQAVVDGFGDHSIQDITAMLSSVGFSSPPAWIKPYHVLSNGERFRCDLARALLGRAIDKTSNLVVFDEFTSVVDRTVARIGSAAVAKAIRRSPSRRFVAVSCHYDIIEWLNAEWILDMQTGELARGRLQRPPITLEIHKTRRSFWTLFAPHHYLSASIHPSATCYLARIDGRPVGFVATIGSLGVPGARRIHRLVVLPDYQGIGIGTALLTAIAALERPPAGMTLCTSHVPLIRTLERSALWTPISLKRGTSRRHRGMRNRRCGPPVDSGGRLTASFRFKAAPG